MSSEDIVRKKIIEFVRNDECNCLPAHGRMMIYDVPLVGFAVASDPMFEELKTRDVIGKNFIAPYGWLASAKSVISFFLPSSPEVRESNRTPGIVSEEWASARIDGEALIDRLKLFTVDLICGLGYDAVAPSLDPRFRIEVLRESECKVSNWSERHVAHIAGLGTFGLHKGLITQKGTAGRFGSVVTSLELAPTERAYQGVFDYCPFISEGKCGLCIKRCPIGAISPDGKDKMACSRYIDNVIKPKFAPRYGCAKCNVAVPCEAAIPKM